MKDEQKNKSSHDIARSTFVPLTMQCFDGLVSTYK